MQSRWDGPWGPSSRRDSDPNLRIGDAERNEISELLSKHYSDGRLDAAEFHERLDRAMTAKTRADLSGLLVDLPSLKTPEQVAAAQVPVRHRHGVVRVVVFALLFLWALSFLGAGVHLWWMHVPWLLILVVVAFLWGRDRSRRRARYRRESLDERPQ